MSAYVGRWPSRAFYNLCALPVALRRWLCHQDDGRAGPSRDGWPTAGSVAPVCLCSKVPPIPCRCTRLTCQIDCWNAQLLAYLVSMIGTDDPELRLWICLTLGKLLNGFEKAKFFCSREKVYELLTRLLSDPSPHVRAACVYCLSKVRACVDPAVAL